jgi:hypothetical protein
MAPPIGRIYHKNYDIAGNKFTVQVCYQGVIPTGHLAQKKAVWFYNLIVNGMTVEMGQWNDLQGRNPSNEEVCDSLAQFWHDSQKIREAQEVGSEGDEALDAIIFKCADWMHAYFMQDTVFRDFEIVKKFMDGNGWEIMISPNYREGVILEFTKFSSDELVKVAVWNIDRKLQTLI